MKRSTCMTVFAGLGIWLCVTVAGMRAAPDTKAEKNAAVSTRTVEAADVAEAFAYDPQKADRDFSPKMGGQVVKIKGRVTAVVNGQALLTNADAKVRVLVPLGDKKAKIGDLIEATVKRLQYDVIAETDGVTIAPEGSGRGARLEK